jgi:hypothetical protein
MEISKIIAKGNNYTPEEVELLKKEVAQFLNKMEASKSEVLTQRSNLIFSPAALEIFFRSKEREEKIGQILQYLLAFLDHSPGTDARESQPLNPIEQLRDCIRYEMDLLLEADIRKAVFNEINQAGSLDGDNVWDYQERLIEKNRELNELFMTGANEASSLFFTLCLVLENLCLFWFDVKKRDMRRIRRGDIYLYKLSIILQGCYRET